ncbi:MAG: hypothetical protein A3B23_02280 [Candidatus Colwellbacteria bacterium RIFCSPLOWO2_01_FULL_48_10]|uniref:Uncharacterized protein n=2 Tax=Bacteria candidate phyla TaxID=1783234 RepID=A0A1F5P3V6_9BACT|nr:MAG: hypothetical protein A2846_03615 [Candidatus Doudnabacteria bacterium RIFCSPHIGHO2_01_FULL_49_9]OGY59952.1 MAG: hypothetical protein A3B23_02280 [Candidatus Colwellbacteria bacterium RIFCSPLOWO2_01_FULL_48_10]
MKLLIPKPKETLIATARRIGYVLQHSNPGEQAFTRDLVRGGYPRFHLYVKERDANNWVFNLHLDQKKPVYEGQTAHSGEYDGSVIEEEAMRMWAILKP